VASLGRRARAVVVLLGVRLRGALLRRFDSGEARGRRCAKTVHSGRESGWRCDDNGRQSWEHGQRASQGIVEDVDPKSGSGFRLTQACQGRTQVIGGLVVCGPKAQGVCHGGRPPSVTHRVRFPGSALVLVTAWLLL
jgi:hypothetical protein